MKNCQKLLISILFIGGALWIIQTPSVADKMDSPIGVPAILFAVGMLSFIAIDWKDLFKFLNK
jgi:hypothetical protein